MGTLVYLHYKEYQMARLLDKDGFVRDMGKTKNMQGLHTHLAFLVPYQWPEMPRPSAMAVRVEDEIIDYVKQILRIRQRAEKEKWTTYLRAEDQLLTASLGKLPSSIRLRASHCYKHSPRVRLWEMLYAGMYCRETTGFVLRDYKEDTGLRQASFEEQLTPSELERWRELQAAEIAQTERAKNGEKVFVRPEAKP